MEQTEIDYWKARIDKMSQREMAEMWRFAEAGHPCFNKTIPLFDYFNKRFKSLGGMTPAISKAIGWKR